MIAEPLGLRATGRVARNGVLHGALAGRAPPPALLAVAILIPIAWLGFSSGGYFATAWGWSSLGFVWAAAMALALSPAAALSRLELAALAALGALCLWTAASVGWAPGATQAVLEVERLITYLAFGAATLLAFRRHSVPALLAGTLGAITAIAGWALLTRLLPDRIGVFDSVSTYRLAAPIGYWNALGLACAIGVLIALGFVLGARGAPARAAAGATLPLLAATLYFTFGRGAWPALGFGAAVMIAAERNRLERTAAAALAVAPAAVAVALASRFDSLVTRQAQLADAAGDGRRLLAATAGLLVVGAAAGAATGSLRGRLHLGPSGRRTGAAALLAVTVAAVLAVPGRPGSPGDLARRAVEAFTTEPVAAPDDLNERLFSLSGNGRPTLWRVAWDEAVRHPVTGAGAGSFEQRWLERRDLPFKVKDAHGLYIETLAELGLVGLGLLVVVLALPLVAGIRARARPFVPATLGAYAAFLVHAAADWDWEITAVTLAALACGCALLVSARDMERRPLSGRARTVGGIALLVLGAVALVGLLGNLSIARSIDAAAAGDWDASARWASRARGFAPWSSEPWRRLGLAEARARDALPFAREAVRRDPRNWELWLELAWFSKGAAKEAALARASALNPLSPEVAEYRRYLEATR